MTTQTKQVCWWVFVALAIMGVMWLTTGCGKEKPSQSLCTLEYEPTVVKTFGTLEHMGCDAGQVILAVEPKWIAGGTITHVELQCAKVRVKCE